MSDDGLDFEPLEQKRGSGVLKKIAIGCAALVVLGILGILTLWGVIRYKKAQYDDIALPFLETYLSDLASWEPDRVAARWAPEIARAMEPEKVDRLFELYRNLGELRSNEEPVFLQVGTHTAVPYPELVTYQVIGHFEGGDAVLTFQLVRASSGELMVWGLHINSDAFLPAAASEHTSGP